MNAEEAAMPVEAVCQLMTTLQDLEALDPAQAKKLEEMAPAWPSLASGIRELVKRGWITTYQANVLNKGKGKDLLVGPYLLLDRLGDGGMGEVFKARHRLIRTRVAALKVIREDRLTDRSIAPQIIGRFIREPEAVALLSHPNIVKVFDAGKDQGKYFMVMEYLEGTDLQRLVKSQGPLPLDQARAFLRQALLGLEHLHQRGMVHRDIKPANLFVAGIADVATVDHSQGTQVEAQATKIGDPRSNNQGQAPLIRPIPAVLTSSRPPALDLGNPEPVLKILDLGLALIRRTSADQETADELTGFGRTLGTPLYMAPEQALHPHGVDIRADLYSLGRTFFYLITGQVPALGQQAITIDALTRLRPDVPTSLAAIVCRLTALAPTERYQTPLEVLHALDKAERPSRPPALPLPPVRRRNYLPHLAAGAGALVLLILLTWGLVVALHSRHTEPDGDIAQGKPSDSKDQGGTPKKDLPITLPKNGGTVPPVTVPSIPKGKLGHSRLLTQHTTQVWSVAFVPGKNQALSCSHAETILWDLENDNPLKKRTRFGTRDFDKAGPDLFPGKGQVPDFDDLMLPTSVAAAPNGKTALFGSTTALTLWDLEDWKKSQVFKFTNSHIVNCWVAYSLDGRRGLYGNYDNVIHLIDVAKKEKLAASFPGGVACFTPDGARVLTGDVIRSGGSVAMVHLWDIDKKVRVKSFGNYKMGVSSLAVSPNGKHALAAGTRDKEAILWDLESYTEIRRLKGHEKGITAVALSSDGKLALTGSDDATARLWDVDTGAEIDRFTQHTKTVHSVVFSPGDNYALTGGEDQGVGVWQLKK